MTIEERGTASDDDLLCTMYAMQERLQVYTYLSGFHPATMDADKQMEYIRTNVLALQDELHEMLGETGWKPWATSNHLNREAYLGEMVDAFHFMMNLMLVAGIGPIEFFNAFIRKNARNSQRQEEGYDGVTGKCPVCRRAYDDVAVECSPQACLMTFDPVVYMRSRAA
jgi:hypothetical protein